MTRLYTYEQLNEKQKAEARGLLRKAWLEDAKAERESFPNDEFLLAVIANLEEDNEACVDMINDALNNTDFQERFTLADGTNVIL